MTKPHDTDSLDTQIIVIEGPTEPNPPPVPESSLRRWETLRELYRQAGRDITGSTGIGPTSENFSNS